MSCTNFPRKKIIIQPPHQESFPRQENPARGEKRTRDIKQTGLRVRRCNWRTTTGPITISQGGCGCPIPSSHLLKGAYFFLFLRAARALRVSVLEPGQGSAGGDRSAMKICDGSLQERSKANQPFSALTPNSSWEELIRRSWDMGYWLTAGIAYQTLPWGIS